MSPRRVVAPIMLGCCPERVPCRLCAPTGPPPNAEFVAALVANTIRERKAKALTVSFFGGPPPSDALLEAAKGHSISVRVRPDLLDRANARRLKEAGVGAVELDALTFHTPTLKGVRRHYTGGRLREMATGLAELGFDVGLVLAPGLPGSSHELMVEDAHTAVDLAKTVRLHPVLVLRRSALWQSHLDGRYTPLTLGQAVTTCRVMMDVLEPAGVKVIRVGQQPGPDGLGRAVAGPSHSSLRELVEARRTLERLRDLMRAEAPKGGVVIRCAMADETRTRGPRNDNIRTLRAEFGLTELTILADPDLGRGQVVLEAS